MSSETSDFEMRVSVPDRESGREILNQLVGNVDDVTFTVDSLGDTGNQPCRLSVDGVTAKQLEAARLAVQMGYYRNPKDAELGDIAAELGVSKSAVSQRLRGLERKLVAELVESCVEENRDRSVPP